jgi:hypothetical protein
MIPGSFDWGIKVNKTVTRNLNFEFLKKLIILVAATSRIFCNSSSLGGIVLSIQSNHSISVTRGDFGRSSFFEDFGVKIFDYNQSLVRDEERERGGGGGKGLGVPWRVDELNMKERKV